MVCDVLVCITYPNIFSWYAKNETSTMKACCILAVGMMSKELMVCDGRISRSFASILKVSCDTLGSE